MSNNYFACNLYWLIENKIIGSTLNNYKPVTDNYKYIEGLISLYFKSTGKDKFEQDSDIDEFVKWVTEYRKLTTRYAKFVMNHDVDLFSPSLAELDKSVVDSIVGRNAKVISESASTLNRLNSRLIQRDDKTYIDNFSTLIIPASKKIMTIITQNPYYINPKLDYSLIHREGYDINIGMYGFDDDINKDEKIDELRRIKEELGCGRLYIEEEGKDYYSLFKASHLPRKSKIKTNIYKNRGYIHKNRSV